MKSRKQCIREHSKASRRYYRTEDRFQQGKASKIEVDQAWNTLLKREYAMDLQDMTRAAILLRAYTIVGGTSNGRWGKGGGEEYTHDEPLASENEAVVV